MPRPKNVKTILATLTPAQIEQLRILLKEDPRVAKLEKRLAALDGKREDLISEIEALKGGKVAREKRGRPARLVKGKPGRPKKVDSTVAGAPEGKRRGRPPKAVAAEVTDTPKKRGRPGKVGISTPEMRRETAATAPKMVKTSEQQSVLDERMAKARTARKAKT